MNFLSKVTATYQIVADGLGYMSRKDLQDKMPELYAAYESAFGNKKPDIKIVSSDHFVFPCEKYDMGSWHVVYAYHQGKVAPVQVDKYYGVTQPLQKDSMILDCMVGHLTICKLYVHPDNAAPLIQGKADLTDDESLVLHCMGSLKPSYREEEFLRMRFKDFKERDKNKGGLYKTVLKSLADKGLVKINAAGASQMTMEGKNRALHVRDIARKYGGY